MAELTVRWHGSMAEIPEAQWHALTATAGLPFYSWTWLVALERSGSVAPRQGWQPCHVTLWRGETLIAAAPLYLKGHSYGEFVFDQSFAELAAQLGQRYYPKLLGMSPLSPVLGYRFFSAAGEDPLEITQLLLQQIDRFCQEQRIFSCNFLYVDPQWQPLAEAAGCATWINQQSLWSNQNYRTFEDYLGSFNANQRRNIKRERKAVQNAGLTVTPLLGADLSDALLARMHHFYAQHCSRWGAWGSKYLTEAFFTEEASALRDHLVLFSAHRGEPTQPVAMSLCVRSEEQLWGRYWGSDEEIDNLHFEVCYYAPIEWAIAQGLRSFDPGAGGSHKRRRGFVARPHASLHRWYHAPFEAILRRWLPEANAQQHQQIEAVNAELPFNASLPALGDSAA
ncbi:GNAT family N-acetyltransferase [Vulcanococcus sp.]|jgi:predicted N-acyltransferase|uniref:GNAT family N-acetyltransferase n=1 Tax=Vulcanococcus sp. TaxID=2856995 RepID=UPI003224FC50